MPPLLRARRSALPSAVTATDQAFRRRIARVVVVLLAALVIGTAGYMLLEGWRLLDALYMTVITLSTVGFTEVHPLTDAGHVFTIALIVSGVSAAAYAVGAIGESVIGGRLSDALRRQRMQREIDRLASHYIVCGYGRVGREGGGRARRPPDPHGGDRAERGGHARPGERDPPNPRRRHRRWLAPSRRD
jgi:hypothetical protein